MPKIVRINSENNDFQYLQVLTRNRKKRNQYRQFFVEGVNPINCAIENNCDIVAFGYICDKSLSNWATDILASSQAQIHYEISAKLMAKLSAKEETSELIAVISKQVIGLGNVNISQESLIIVLDRPSSPGNLGTIIRSADAFRAQALVLTGHSADMYDPQVIRSSVGTIFSLPVIWQPSSKQLADWFAKQSEFHQGLQIVGSSVHTNKEITEVNLKKPTVLVLGNERDGLSNHYREICDEIVKIPIYGTASSLNLACAASIFMYEIARQRGW